MSETEQSEVKPKKSFKRRFLKWSAIIFLFFFLTFGGLNLWVIHTTSGKIFNTVNEVPQSEVAVVFGTARYVGKNRENVFFKNRIKAAAELFKQGKVKKIIVSGDNGTRYYNETLEMKKSLIAMGIPADAVVSDFAGFRTFDSVVRSRDVFGAQKIIFVSQGFHLSRALFIASSKGIDATGFAADDPPHNGSYYKVWARETFARVGAVLDCYVLQTEAKYPGPEPEHHIDFTTPSTGSAPEGRN